jgi:hypothetical protein
VARDGGLAVGVDGFGEECRVGRRRPEQGRFLDGRERQRDGARHRPVRDEMNAPLARAEDEQRICPPTDEVRCGERAFRRDGAHEPPVF